MIIKDYKLYETRGTNAASWVFVAEVTIETGFWLWKKTRKELIQRQYASHWFFVESGEWCPGLIVNNLERSYNAKNNLYF